MVRGGTEGIKCFAYATVSHPIDCNAGAMLSSLCLHIIITTYVPHPLHN